MVFLLFHQRSHPLTFVFLGFALRGRLFLFQGLGVGMLSPPAQLEVDKLPHHEGLREANGCQDGHSKARQKKKKSI